MTAAVANDMPEPAAAKPRKPYLLLNVASATGLVMLVLLEVFARHYSIGLTAQSIRCLPSKVYFVKKGAPASFKKGDILQFTALGLGPVIKDGLTLTKVVAGMPGDHVVVDERGMWINNKFWGPHSPLIINKLKIDPASLRADYVIPKDKVLMMGTMPGSYDGRYWGLVPADKITGSATPLW